MAQDVLSDPEIEDNLVAKVEGRQISFENILQRLILGKNWRAIEDCLDQALIENAFSKHGITTNDSEDLAWLTSFRQKHHLLTAEETSKWLETHHMDDDDFMQMCQYELKLEKLKNLLFKQRLEQAFVYMRLDLQTVELYKIVVAQEEAAREIVSSVQEGASFFEYARKYSLDGKTAKSCGYTGKVKLKELPPQVQDLLSKGTNGALIGPVKVNKNFEIYLIESMDAPVLDEAMARQLEDQLFAQWLADTKARAQIELFI